MKKLLVESQNDLFFIVNLFEKVTGKSERVFTVIDCKNVSDLIKRISPELIAPDTDVLAVVVDADENVEKRWKELKKAFEDKGYSLPQKPALNGTIIEKQGLLPKIGIWMMPNNLKTGKLEDFIREIIPQNDKLAPIVSQTLDNLETQELRLYRPIDRPKAFIHTWLAWQDEPGKPFGWAVTKRYFDLDAVLAQSFVSWLKDLFVEPQP